MINYYIRSNI